MAKYGTFKYGDGTKYGVSANPNSDVSWVVLVDWNGDGAYDGTNEAQWLIDCAISRGRKYALQPSQRGGVSGFEGQEYGNAELTFTDTDRRYDPYNTGSPIYPVLAGRKCQIRVKENATDTTHIVFTGWITSITPNSETDEVTMTVKDGWYWLSTQRITNETINLNVAITDAMNVALTSAEFPAVPAWALNSDTQPVRVFSLRRVNAASVMQDLADAALGNFFFSASGVPTFYPRNYNSQTTHDLDQAQILREIIRSQPWEMIVNDVTCIAHRIVKRRTSDIWSLGDPLYIAAGESATISAEYDPATEVVISDKVANMLIDESGADLTAKFVIASANYQIGTVDITVTNTSAKNGYLTKLVISGRVLSDNPGPYTHTDATSQAAYGPRYFTLDSDYLQSRNYADAFAAIILEKYKSPNVRLICAIDQRQDIQYNFELQDKVAFTSATLDIDETLYVLGIEHRWRKDTGQDVRTTLYLGPTIYDNTSITAEEVTEETEIPEDGETPPPPVDEGNGDDDDITPPKEDGAVAITCIETGVYVTGNLASSSPEWIDKEFPGTTAIDADTMYYNLDVYFAITEGEIYRITDARTLEASEWTKVFDVATDW